MFMFKLDYILGCSFMQIRLSSMQYVMISSLYWEKRTTATRSLIFFPQQKPFGSRACQNFCARIFPIELESCGKPQKIQWSS